MYFDHMRFLLSPPTPRYPPFIMSPQLQFHKFMSFDKMHDSSSPASAACVPMGSRAIYWDTDNILGVASWQKMTFPLLGAVSFQ